VHLRGVPVRIDAEHDVVDLQAALHAVAEVGPADVVGAGRLEFPRGRLRAASPLRISL
jgi:hypothetical protein